MTGDGQSVADGRYVTVVDRFEVADSEGSEGEGEGESEDEDEGEVAVLLLESNEEVVAERAVPRWRLPEAARQQDAVLEVVLRNGFVVSTSYDPEATERRTAEAQSQFDRLAERPDEDSDR